MDSLNRRAEDESFLGRLDAGDHSALVAIGQNRTYSPGANLLTPQQHCTRVMFILRGRVKITHTTAEGRVLLLSVLGPGEPLGEQSAIDKVPVHITATALEPVEVMVVAAPDFVHWVSTRRTASVALLQYWSARLRKADSERVEFVMNDTLGRVAGRLVELTERYGVPSGAHVRIALPLSQEELGSWAGSSREATSRALQSLRRRRLIATRRREIMVLDPRAMRARATADS